MFRVLSMNLKKKYGEILTLRSRSEVTKFKQKYKCVAFLVDNLNTNPVY